MTTENKSSELIAIANELETFIQLCVPKSKRYTKYGGTLFTIKPGQKEGQFCGVFIYSAHVQLSISNGGKLEDERRMLIGTGKTRRHVNFKAHDQIDYDYLKGLICQAAKY